MSRVHPEIESLDEARARVEKEARIKLVTGPVEKSLDEMSQAAFELIQCIELEKTGLLETLYLSTLEHKLQSMESIFLKYRCLTDEGYENGHMAELNAICAMYEEKRKARAAGESL